ncbi:MAG: hypothetical protein JWQ94_4724, partial [Tardiphaga sp.]|nr:hypothetical protein [Tardiphaga sp.]
AQKKPDRPSAEQTELQNWLISETTSPVDYAPQISASTVGRELASGAPAWLTIYCRGRHADLAISTDSIRKTISSMVLKVVYRINSDNPVEARWKLSDNRTAIVLQGEAGSLLQLMPDQGRMNVKVHASSQRPIELDYQLDGLSFVRRRIAKACNLSSS